MALSLNKPKLDNLTNEIWKSAERLRGKFKSYEYQGVILPIIVMLPDQLFYNTGIFTYIWLLRNDKPASHKGRVMLIDARQQFEKEPKAFGNKRNRITATIQAQIATLTAYRKSLIHECVTGQRRVTETDVLATL